MNAFILHPKSKLKQSIVDIVIYGVSLAILLIGLKMAQFKFLIYHHSIEIYTALIALFFTIFGLWLAGHLTLSKKGQSTHSFSKSIIAKPILDKCNNADVGLSSREMEILSLIIEGHSNQEISSILFISLSTVKSHVSNIFTKLNVKRRTQAIEAARQLNIFQHKE